MQSITEELFYDILNMLIYATPKNKVTSYLDCGSFSDISNMNLLEEKLCEPRRCQQLARIACHYRIANH